MEILFWIIFGLIAGSIANFISPNFRGGIIASIILGIVGAVVGGFLGERLFGIGVSGFNISSFILAVAGSLLVLWITRMLMHN